MLAVLHALLNILGLIAGKDKAEVRRCRGMLIGHVICYAQKVQCGKGGPLPVRHDDTAGCWCIRRVRGTPHIFYCRELTESIAFRLLSAMHADHRSTEAPMDFQWTSRPSSGTKPVWATPTNDSNTHRKRTFPCPLCMCTHPKRWLPRLFQ